MDAPTPTPVRVDPGALGEREIAAFNAHDNAIRAEMDPTLQPRPIRETRAILLSPPEYQRYVRWWAWEGGVIVAAAVLEIAEGVSSNRHIAEFDISVLPDFRRRGLATRLVRMIAEEATAADRRLLLAITSSAVEAGAWFMEHIGASPGIDDIANQVQMADLDRGLLDEWIEAGARRSDEYELVWWEGPIPDESLDEVVDLLQVMNDAPFGDLELDDFEFSAENIRQDEAALAARSFERWVLAVRHRESGRLAGYTALYFNPTLADLAQQGDTGVFPAHRGRGLGRWLKATTAKRLLDERPEITRIRTGNAASNEPMLRINYEMGFKPYRSERVWQIAVDDVGP